MAGSGGSAGAALVSGGRSDRPLDANFSVNQQFDLTRLCASVDHCGLLGIHVWPVCYTATSTTISSWLARRGLPFVFFFVLRRLAGKAGNSLSVSSNMCCGDLLPYVA